MHIKRELIIGLIAAFAISGAGYTTAKRSDFRGMKAVEIENQGLKLIVMPERGANIISILDKHSGREWVWQNPRFTYRQLPYATAFSEGDTSGFDDCFPTVGESQYPEGAWKGITMPDHGEIWTLPSEYTLKNSSVRFRTYGIRLPYVFEKEIILAAQDRITIRYKVTNPTSEPMLANWAAHFLVKTSPGMEIFLPEHTQIRDGMPGWRVWTDNGLDWIALTGPETKQTIKRFTEKLSEGYGGFYDPKTNEFLALLFSTRELPYFGIWINQGGYPSNDNQYNAAMEPTDGDENYELSEKRGIRNCIPAKSTVKWEISILVGKSGKAELYKKLSGFRQ